MPFVTYNDTFSNYEWNIVDAAPNLTSIYVCMRFWRRPADYGLSALFVLYSLLIVLLSVDLSSSRGYE